MVVVQYEANTFVFAPPPGGGLEVGLNMRTYSAVKQGLDPEDPQNGGSGE